MSLAAALLICLSPTPIDGDDLRCGAVNVRLVAVNARERSGKCRRGAPCPAASAEAARLELGRLTAGQRVECVPVGSSHGRIVARCRVGAIDLSCALQRAGLAAEWRRYGRACAGTFQPALNGR